MASVIELGKPYTDQEKLIGVAVAQCKYFRGNHTVCLYYEHKEIDKACEWLHVAEVELTTCAMRVLDLPRVNQALLHAAYRQ